MKSDNEDQWNKVSEKTWWNDVTEDIKSFELS